MRSFAALVPIVMLSGAMACDTIEGTPLTKAPSNACPCDAYPRDARNVASSCDSTSGRCIFGVVGGDPGYDFTLAIHVPDTSVYAAGQTFFASNSELSKSRTDESPTCKAPTCLNLRRIVEVSGAYRVERDAAVALGAPFEEAASVPLRVRFFPEFGTPPSDAHEAGLPADTLFASSVRVSTGADTFDVKYLRQLSTGSYVRYAYPEAPYDEIVPPAVNEITVSRAFEDAFSLGATRLDDPSGLSRQATVERAGGLDGLRIWLAETKTGRRVSVVKSLTGTKAQVVLHTVGQTRAFNDGALDVVVAPPDTWFGFPTLRSTLIGGQGLKDIVFPALPAPIAVTGLVGASESGVLTAVPSRLAFRSRSLRGLDGADLTLLEYRTTVATDEAGGFTTVLPLGLYDVVVEPAEGTGFAKFRQAAVEVRSSTLKLQAPNRRSFVTGRAFLTDGRPLAEAEIFAVAAKSQTEPAVVPRPGRTRTNPDGSFSLEVDRGDYEIWVQPQAGSGFPRVVVLRKVTEPSVDLGRLEVPPPTRLSFDIKFDVKEPSRVSRPIARAVVRAYARPTCATPPCPVLPAVEVASTMTNEAGKCEILLAQAPR